MYWVRSRFYNSGKADIRIFLESECFEMDRSNKETANFDEYWDSFKTFEEAEEFATQEI